MGIRTHVLVSIGAAAAGLLLLAGAAPAGTGPVKVQRTIPFSEASGASDAVRSECQLETKVPEFLSRYSEDVELVDALPRAGGRVLALTITQVHAPGGGAFSGPKILTVEGTLRENGKAVGSFTATRYSGGGAFGAYKGTCSIVGRCAKTIGKDIAGWLRNPEDGAHLGDG